MNNKIVKMIAENLNLDRNTINLDSKLDDDLGLTSFDLFELAIEIEEAFSIQITSADLHNFFTLGDLVRFVENKISAN